MWRRPSNTLEIFNVASKDWITINEVSDIVIETLGLREVKKIYKPVLHGVGRLGDVKRMALTIDKLKNLGWKPKMNSRQAVQETTKNLISELRA